MHWFGSIEVGNGVAQLGRLLFLYLYLYSYFGLDLYDQIGKVCQNFYYLLLELLSL